MATKAELEAKIKKAKANEFMPEGLKKTYIEKIEKELKALKKPSIDLPDWSGTDWEGEVYENIEEIGEMDRSDAQGVAEGAEKQYKTITKSYVKKLSAKKTAEEILKATAVKKEKKSTPKAKKTDEPSCEEMLAAWKKRRAESKNRTEKTPLASSTSAIENAIDSVEKKYKNEDLSKANIEKIIKILMEEIEYLKKLLKKAN